LTSYKQALRLNNEVPGLIIPEPLLKSLEAAGTAARERGFQVQKKCWLGRERNWQAHILFHRSSDTKKFSTCCSCNSFKQPMPQYSLSTARGELRRQDTASTACNSKLSYDGAPRREFHSR